MNKIFDWTDFKHLDTPAESLAEYCNRLVDERTTRVKLCQHAHDVIRADANWTQEYLSTFPYEARMTRPFKNE